MRTTIWPGQRCYGTLAPAIAPAIGRRQRERGMAGQQDAEWHARLSEFVQRGDGRDLEEIARMIGQTDPFKDFPVALPDPPADAAPGWLSQTLSRLTRKTDPQANRWRKNRPTSTS
jgi:hypothetical protein